MSKAIGMVEYKTVSAGVVAADAMVKTSEVSIIEAQTVCPGKYIVIISGDLSAVNAAVETAKTLHEKHLINSFVLGNPHESIFPAIYGAAKIEEVSALGIMETYDATTIIVAADEAAKTAIVDLVELRVARGMCGKSYLMLTGEVAAVEAAIERAKMVAAEGGMYRGFFCYRTSGRTDPGCNPVIKKEQGRDRICKTAPCTVVVWCSSLYRRRAKVRACPRPWRLLPIPECAFWHFW